MYVMVKNVPCLIVNSFTKLYHLIVHSCCFVHELYACMLCMYICYVFECMGINVCRNFKQGVSLVSKNCFCHGDCMCVATSRLLA